MSFFCLYNPLHVFNYCGSPDIVSLETSDDTTKKATPLGVAKFCCHKSDDYPK